MKDRGRMPPDEGDSKKPMGGRKHFDLNRKREVDTTKEQAAARMRERLKKRGDNPTVIEEM